VEGGIISVTGSIESVAGGDSDRIDFRTFEEAFDSVDKVHAQRLMTPNENKISRGSCRRKWQKSAAH
jgi:hypothetical protein